MALPFQRAPLSSHWVSFFILKLKITADMSDSIKKKIPIHSPLFFRWVFSAFTQSYGFSMAAIN